MTENVFLSQFRILFIILLLVNVQCIQSSSANNSSLYPDNVIESDLTTITSNTVNAEEYTFEKQYQYDNSLGAMNDLFIVGELAYVAIRWGGLVIFNISDSTKPTILGSYNEQIERSSYGDLTSGVFVRETVAFVADGAYGLLILNVSNPREPIKIGEYREENNYWRKYCAISVNNNFAYILSSFYFIILNISDLSSPSKIAEMDYVYSNTIVRMHVKNEFVFIGENLGPGVIIDVSDPNNPNISIELENTRACAIQQEYLITAVEPNRLTIYELTSLPLLSVLTNYTIPIIGSVEFLCVNDEYAYVGSKDEIVVLNITDISNISVICTIPDLKWLPESGDVWIDRVLVTTNEQQKRDLLLFIDYQQGLFIHNVSKPEGETLIGTYDNGMRAELVTGKGEYIYLASRPEIPYYPMELDIFTMKNEQLERVGGYSSGLDIDDIAINDEDIAFLAAGNGIEVVNISDATKPERISLYSYPEPLFTWGFYYDQMTEIIYLCGGVDGLFILDVSDVQDISCISQVSSFNGYGYQAYEVFVYENIAFVADSQTFGGFGMIDVTNPANPVIIDYIPLNEGIHGIYVENNVAYISARATILRIFDVSNKEDVQLLSKYGNSGSQGSFVLQNGICYFPQMDLGITLIDVQDNTNLKSILTVKDSLTGLCMDVWVNDSLIFLADAWDGLEVWELSIQETHLIRNIVLITLSTLTLSISVVILVIYLRRKKKKLINNIQSENILSI
ncbi:MAG: LVIVD repeat-containing protein [Candidatus Heimdallarchaeaceae archaeon]